MTRTCPCPVHEYVGIVAYFSFLTKYRLLRSYRSDGCCQFSGMCYHRQRIYNINSTTLHLLRWTVATRKIMHASHSKYITRPISLASNLLPVHQQYGRVLTHVVVRMTSDHDTDFVSSSLPTPSQKKLRALRRLLPYITRWVQQYFVQSVKASSGIKGTNGRSKRTQTKVFLEPLTK